MNPGTRGVVKYSGVRHVAWCIQWVQCSSCIAEYVQVPYWTIILRPANLCIALWFVCIPHKGTHGSGLLSLFFAPSSWYQHSMSLYVCTRYNSQRSSDICDEAIKTCDISHLKLYSWEFCGDCKTEGPLFTALVAGFIANAWKITLIFSEKWI